MNKQTTLNYGLVNQGRIYSSQQSSQLLDYLIKHVAWQTEYFAFGRRFDVPRSQAWYSDEGIHYRYTDNMLKRHAWTPYLLSIKQRVEKHVEHRFNSVLITYYRCGDDHVTWHADDEVELGDTPVIASLSLGATRSFHWRSKQGNQSAHLPLNDGELLLMKPKFQLDWEHCVPPEPSVKTPRINLTFRNVVQITSFPHTDEG